MLDYYSNYEPPNKDNIFLDFCNHFIQEGKLPDNLIYDFNDDSTKYLLTDEEKALYTLIKHYVNTKDFGSLTGYHVFYKDYICEINFFYKGRLENLKKLKNK